jgi:hypothetical protein
MNEKAKANIESLVLFCGHLLKEDYYSCRASSHQNKSLNPDQRVGGERLSPAGASQPRTCYTV